MKTIAKENYLKVNRIIEKYKTKNNPDACREALKPFLKDMDLNGNTFLEDNERLAIISEKEDYTDCWCPTQKIAFLDMIYCHPVSEVKNVYVKRFDGSLKMYDITSDTILLAL